MISDESFLSVRPLCRLRLTTVNMCQRWALSSACLWIPSWRLCLHASRSLSAASNPTTASSLRWVTTWQPRLMHGDRRQPDVDSEQTEWLEPFPRSPVVKKQNDLPSVQSLLPPSAWRGWGAFLFHYFNISLDNNDLYLLCFIKQTCDTETTDTV